MDLEKTLTLRKPVTLGDVQFSELKLREPTAGELEKASTGAGAASGMGISINLISLVAKVPRKVVEDLGARDFQEASDFFGQFAG